jgi:hypothetical protein
MEEAMKIEILGTGCYNCVKLESLIDEILVELGRKDVEIVRINDEYVIRKYMPLDELPGLLINGILASTREVPEREALKSWFRKTEVKAV